MFELNSKTKAGIVRAAAAAVAVSLISLQAPEAGAAESDAAKIGDNSAPSVELKPLSPQIDTAPPVDATPPASEPPPKLHKLEASKRALREEEEDSDDSDMQMPTVQIETSPQTMKQIIINTSVLRANIPNTAITDPFTLMRALLGARSKEYEKLYAERDTGYGVCGFLMNMPIMQRGYALVLKCFPSMPAAEANLQAGDLITSVNGQSTLDLPPKEVWDWFTGMPGTEVKIEVLRGRQPISVTLRRMDIGRIPDFATRAEFLTLYKHNGMSKFVQK